MIIDKKLPRTSIPLSKCTLLSTLHSHTKIIVAYHS